MKSGAVLGSFVRDLEAGDVTLGEEVKIAENTQRPRVPIGSGRLGDGPGGHLPHDGSKTYQSSMDSAVISTILRLSPRRNGPTP